MPKLVARVRRNRQNFNRADAHFAVRKTPLIELDVPGTNQVHLVAIAWIYLRNKPPQQGFESSGEYQTPFEVLLIDERVSHEVQALREGGVINDLTAMLQRKSTVA